MDSDFIESLPSERYRMLLGTCICAFNQNNGFIVTNILEVDDGRYNWYDLISLTSGRLSDRAKKTIAMKCGGTEISDLFSEIIVLRNNIMHSFQVTSSDGHQILRRKERLSKQQFDVDEAYLLEFIAKNAQLSQLLKDFNKQHRTTPEKSHPNTSNVVKEEC